MVDTSFPKLSDGQRDCLRLVLVHLNSKEISRELGISPHTVDQRLRGAMRVLGVNSRFEASRKFAEHEGRGPYQPLIYQPSDIENISNTANLDESTRQEKEVASGLNTKTSNIGGSAVILNFDQTVTKANRFPFPRFRGEKNELSTLERLGWIIIIAIGSALSFGGILAGLEALSRLRV